MDKNITQLDFNVGKNKEYKVETIRDIIVYAIESKSGHLLVFYYLVLWKNCLEKENTLELASMVQYIGKLISLLHKNHPNKLIAIFLSIDTISLIVRLIIKPIKLIK